MMKTEAATTLCMIDISVATNDHAWCCQKSQLCIISTYAFTVPAIKVKWKVQKYVQWDFKIILWKLLGNVNISFWYSLGLRLKDWRSYIWRWKVQPIKGRLMVITIHPSVCSSLYSGINVTNSQLSKLISWFYLHRKSWKRRNPLYYSKYFTIIPGWQF